MSERGWPAKPAVLRAGRLLRSHVSERTPTPTVFLSAIAIAFIGLSAVAFLLPHPVFSEVHAGTDSLALARASVVSGGVVAACTALAAAVWLCTHGAQRSTTLSPALALWHWGWVYLPMWVYDIRRAIDSEELYSFMDVKTLPPAVWLGNAYVYGAAALVQQGVAITAGVWLFGVALRLAYQEDLRRMLLAAALPLCWVSYLHGNALFVYWVLD